MQTESRAMAFFCVISCDPDIFDRIADTDFALDLTDGRQMEILYSDLVGILVIPSAMADSGAEQYASPDRTPFSPVDAFIASRAAQSTPPGGTLY